jgi:hypothetical protein
LPLLQLLQLHCCTASSRSRRSFRRRRGIRCWRSNLMTRTRLAPFFRQLLKGKPRPHCSNHVGYVMCPSCSSVSSCTNRHLTRLRYNSDTFLPIWVMQWGWGSCTYINPCPPAHQLCRSQAQPKSPSSTAKPNTCWLHPITCHGNPNRKRFQELSRGHASANDSHRIPPHTSP